MWEIALDKHLLEKHKKFIIFCATEPAEREMANILDALGCRYPHGSSIHTLTPYHSLKTDFCYYVNLDTKEVRHGTKKTAFNFNSYIKCTYHEGTIKLDELKINITETNNKKLNDESITCRIKVAPSYFDKPFIMEIAIPINEDKNTYINKFLHNLLKPEFEGCYEWEYSI